MQDVNPLSQLLMVKLLRHITAGVRVVTVYPRDADGDLIVVQRVGGTMTNPITDNATFSIQVFDNTQFAAEQLASAVWRALYRQEWAGLRLDGHMLRGWKSAGAPQMFIDPERPHHVRFQFAGQLMVSTLQSN